MYKSAILKAETDATVKNSGDLTIKNAKLPIYGMGWQDYPVAWMSNTAYGLLASNSGVAENSGTIMLEGAGLFGMGASKDGTISNTGSISLNGFIPILDDKGNTTGETAYTETDSNGELRGAGMVAGSDTYDSSNAHATNTGAITVSNSGFGMLALGGGTVINQGSITLKADADTVKDSSNSQLVGLGAMYGGIAINDTTGKIVIDSSASGIATPFYTDSGHGSVIINKGQICIGDATSCSDAATYNPTDSFVSDERGDGSVLSATGATVALTSGVYADGNVSNAGTISGSDVTIADAGVLTNASTGSIANMVVVESSGKLDNQGSISGTITSSGSVINSGTISHEMMLSGDGSLTNNTGGVIQGGFQTSNGSMRISNHGSIFADNGKDIWMQSSAQGVQVFTNETDGTFSAVNSRNIQLDGGSVMNNLGTITGDGSSGGRTTLTLGSGDKNYIVNSGTISQLSGSSNLIGTAGDADTGSLFWNQSAGTVNFAAGAAGKAAVSMTNTNTNAQNDGTMNISGNGAVAMTGSKNAQLVNKGTINLGTEGTDESGMVAMQLDANATTDALVQNDGTINIYAKDSYAFSTLGPNGRVVNNGTVNLAGEGSGLIKQGDSVNVEGLNGNNGNNTAVDYSTYTLPTAPAEQQVVRSSISGYTVGTNADGSAGVLQVNHADLDDVTVNTGFAAGTADTTVQLNNVVQGEDIQGAENIQSTSVVWNAQGEKDTNGNVDVTMTKNAYSDVASESSVSSVANALDASYTNNALFTSLNLGTQAEVNNALNQISGNQATTAFREARVLSNRFDMLEDTAMVNSNGLGFNVVAKGDKRAELGNTQYDMMALSQKFSLSPNQNMKLQYGIARLDSNGDVKSAGDNGLTGGYSQFFGLEHSLKLNENYNLDTALRYDNQQLDSSRSIQYTGVNETAQSSNNQQYMELKSGISRGFALSDALSLKPSAGVKLRHTVEGAMKETGANDFNLKMDSSTETAVDAIIGMQLDYAGKNGWSASAKLEGGPNLSYSKSQRNAELQGAKGQRFSVEDGQKGGGVNGLAQVGMHYNQGNTTVGVDAYNWKEDSASDQGLNLNLKVDF